VLAKHAVSFATRQTGGRRQDRGEGGCGSLGRTSALPSEADISSARIPGVHCNSLASDFDPCPPEYRMAAQTGLFSVINEIAWPQFGKRVLPTLFSGGCSGGVT
jgi:hypothetical protein